MEKAYRPASDGGPVFSKALHNRFYCTVTLTLVACETAPDCAVTVTEAVPRLVGALVV